MCPVNQGTLAWLSVFGHVFATTAVLWILLDISKVGHQNRSLTVNLVIRWYLLLLIASTSFGVGLGVAMGFGAVIFLSNPEPSKRGRLAIIFGSLAFVIPALYVWGNWARTSFAAESTFTPSFVWSSISSDWLLVVTMLVKLVSYAATALLLGPLVVGRGAIVPVETLLSVSLATRGLDCFENSGKEEPLFE